MRKSLFVIPEVFIGNPVVLEKQRFLDTRLRGYDGKSDLPETCAIALDYEQ